MFPGGRGRLRGGVAGAPRGGRKAGSSWDRQARRTTMGFVAGAASQVGGWRPSRTQPNWRLQWTGYAAGGSPGQLTWG
jgi:hypothetical protein